jgi:putative ABC transport system ATP-binding protein
VFQRFNLLDSLSARENVEIALNLNGRKRREARERARKLLMDLGMTERLDFAPALLSGGEQQRVSIARALANDPPIILADEPTANLDSQQGGAVVSLLRGIAKREDRTVVIVSHDERIQRFADRTLWLADGRFVNGAPLMGSAADRGPDAALPWS